MNKTVVINVVGLTKELIGDHTPFLKKWSSGRSVHTIKPAFPAVTCTAQANYLTGKYPESHGIVGNGWYFHEECEIKFWKQSNKLMQSPKVWELLKKKDPSFTCANMFWWYNMYSVVDYAVTPRPNYLADGRKLPDCYSVPAELRDELQEKFGQFPLFQFWGPGANIKSTQWIADASIYTDKKYDPTLTLIYLPHLDYCLQKYGQDFSRIKRELGEVDAVVRQLVDHYRKKNTRIILLSEYGITNVNNPIAINRILRKEGMLQIRVERGLELLDAGASRAFAVADHQVAHIYINDSSVASRVRSIVEGVPGVELVLDRREQERYGIHHERAGDLVLMADARSWFTYYFWLDDAKAPDYARSVDIHKKPGYDPVEMFMSSKLRAGYKLLRKKVGLRYVMDVIPLDPTLVKGSHGRIGTPKEFHPVFIANGVAGKELNATDVYGVIWDVMMC